MAPGASRFGGEPKVSKPIRGILRTTSMLRICLTVIMSLSVLGAMAEDGSIRASAGEMVENIACKADPTQTYTLYLPTTFENTRKWPVLLVFDPRGHRLGYGKGYYDRLLADLPATTTRIGLAFDCQLVDCLPQESHDQQVDWVVTESKLIDCRSYA